MAIPADEYDAFKTRLPSVYPELEVDSFEGVMRVDRQRRLEGRPVSSIGQALEDTFARVRPSWSDPAEAD